MWGPLRACAGSTRRLLLLPFQLVGYLIRRLCSGLLWCMLQPFVCLTFGALDLIKAAAGLVKRAVQGERWLWVAVFTTGTDQAPIIAVGGSGE